MFSEQLKYSTSGKKEMGLIFCSFDIPLIMSIIKICYIFQKWDI